MESVLFDISDAHTRTLLEFALTAIFSLLIGLEQRRLYGSKHPDHTFGTDRTFTFIGILGFILYSLSGKTPFLFLTGAIALVSLLSVFYFHKIKVERDFGLTSVVVALITYCLAPLVATQPYWLVTLIVVTVLILTELKGFFVSFSEKFDSDEFITVGKFLALVGVILPILPDDPLFGLSNLTPYKVWLAVVAISTVSYVSYLVRKFLFSKSGILLSGALGGLYSSTATTMVLARQSKSNPDLAEKYAGGAILATGAMYIRVLILIWIFNRELALVLTPYIVFLFLLSTTIGLWISRAINHSSSPLEDTANKNPLELRVAFLFAFLFILFSLITHYVIQDYGLKGLDILSFAIGFTDIDPFLLNLFQGTYAMQNSILAAATLQAIMSNNILKAGYIFILGERRTDKLALLGYTFVISGNLIAAILVRVL